LNSSNISELLDSLYSLERLGIKMGLEHTEELLKSIGNPQKRLKFIHIAGTNGKGSTSAHIESVLRKTGRKVGLYTSPHLINFNERIRINGVPITDSGIVSFLEPYWASIKKIESTFFETTTAMAFNYFDINNVDIAIIETGLGGRLDSTNVIKPLFSIITSISFDHIDILGNSLEEIAEEKAGIIKKGVPLITLKQNIKIDKVLSDKANNVKSRIVLSDPPSKIKITSSGTEFSQNNTFYKTGLIGKHQAENASLAITALKFFDPKINDEDINNSFIRIVWPGRLQKLGFNIYYDVAHNQDGLKLIIDYLEHKYPNKKIFGLFCLKGDKDLGGISKILSNKFSKLYISTDKNNQLLSGLSLSKTLKKNGVDSDVLSSVKVGVSKLIGLTKKNSVGLIFGTHYIAEEVFNEFEISFDRGII
jgi:dihydrofolate synthase/folylpolyglutamate synthase